MAFSQKKYLNKKVESYHKVHKECTKNSKLYRKKDYFVFFVMAFLCELCGFIFYEKAIIPILADNCYIFYP